MKLFTLLLLALLAPAIHAATTAPVLESCPSGTNTAYRNVPVNTTLPVVWSIVSQGDAIGMGNLRCSTIAQAGANTSLWYVKYSPDNGATWAWAKLSILTPPPAPTITTITWSAVTTDTTGAPLVGAVTYSIYRGISATALSLLASGITALVTTDKVAVDGTYWYAVSATCAGREGAQSNPVSVALTSGVVVSPAPVTNVIIK